MFEPGSWEWVVSCVLMLLGAFSVLCMVGIVLWVLADLFRARPVEQAGSVRQFTVPREVPDFDWRNGR